jgi:hypothetical protein
MYQPGDRVVYTTTKHSAHPGPNAEDVEPEPHGEGYSYNVRKYWLVLDVRDDRLTVITRRGKRRQVPSGDPRLRPARWWESLLLSSRFPPNPSHDQQVDHNPSDRSGAGRVARSA